MSSTTDERRDDMFRTRLMSVMMAAGVVAGLVAIVAACGDDSDAGGSAASTSSAGEFCEKSGGTVETRSPYLNTNLDQSEWVRLPGELELCRFISDDADKSRIYIDTESLAADTPSLAAAAYLAKLPIPADTGGANPAAVNCDTTVGGAAGWRTSANGGGWVKLDNDVFTGVDLCTLSDRPVVAQWGIAYYSNGTIRGIDLAKVCRFDPKDAAAIFPPSQ